MREAVHNVGRVYEDRRSSDMLAAPFSLRVYERPLCGTLSRRRPRFRLRTRANARPHVELV